MSAFGGKADIQLLPRMRVIGTAGTAEPPPLGVKVVGIWRPYADLSEALLQSHRPFTPCSQPSDLMTKLGSEPRPTDLYALCLGSRHASSGPFANLLRLYLR